MMITAATILPCFIRMTARRLKTQFQRGSKQRWTAEINPTCHKLHAVEPAPATSDVLDRLFDQTIQHNGRTTWARLQQ